MSPTKLENSTHNNGEPVVGRPVQLEVWSLQLLLHDFTVAAASAIKICPVLVSHLYKKWPIKRFKRRKTNIYIIYFDQDS